LFSNTFNLLPKLIALDNVGLPLLYANGIEKEERNYKANEMLKLEGLGDKLLIKPNEMSGGKDKEWPLQGLWKTLLP